MVNASKMDVPIERRRCSQCFRNCRYIFRIVLIDQEIPQHDIIWGAMVFKAVEKFLLIHERYLGIRDKERWDKCMSMVAFFTPDPLHNEGYKG